jgi:hypothetical protein
MSRFAGCVRSEERKQQKFEDGCGGPFGRRYTPLRLQPRTCSYVGRAAPELRWQEAEVAKTIGTRISAYG